MVKKSGSWGVGKLRVKGGDRVKGSWVKGCGRQQHRLRDVAV